MTKNEQQIRALLARYDEGLTTEQEERELRALFAAEQVLPRDLQAAAMMFEGFAALADEPMPMRLNEPPKETPVLRSARNCRLQRWSGWAVAAALAIGLFVLAERVNTPYCYVNGVAIYDAEEALVNTACLASLDRLDRSMELFDELILTTKK